MKTSQNQVCYSLRLNVAVNSLAAFFPHGDVCTGKFIMSWKVLDYCALF